MSVEPLQTKILSSLQLKDAFIILITVSVASIANVLLKIGGSRFVQTFSPIDFLIQNRLIILGYVLYLLPTLSTMYLYKKYKMGFVQALLSVTYISIPLLGWLIRIEQLNMYKIIGILVIFFSVIYISQIKQS